MPYLVKGFLETKFVDVGILFTQNSEVEGLFCAASSSSEPSLFFSNYLFGLGFKPIQDDFQHFKLWVLIRPVPGVYLLI